MQNACFFSCIYKRRRREKKALFLILLLCIFVTAWVSIFLLENGEDTLVPGRKWYIENSKFALEGARARSPRVRCTYSSKQDGWVGMKTSVRYATRVIFALFKDFIYVLSSRMCENARMRGCLQWQTKRGACNHLTICDVEQCHGPTILVMIPRLCWFFRKWGSEVSYPPYR